MPPTKTSLEQPDWGLLPLAVRRQIKQREWDNPTNLKARLLGKRPFPIKINLKPPTGRRAIQDIAHYQTYVAAWRGYPQQHRIEWETRTYRDIGEQRVPRYLKITEIQDLILIIGAEAEAKSQHRAAVMTPLLELSGDKLYPVMIKHLDSLDKMTEQDSQRLKHLIEQLRPGMGAGGYLRALPLEGVDTKRLEQNQTIITDILDAQHAGAVTEAGGLHAWLDCAQNPTGWLWVRPLCPETR